MYTIRVMIMRFHLSKSIHPMLLFENPLESWTVLMVGKQVFIILLTILIIILIIIIIIIIHNGMKTKFVLKGINSMELIMVMVWNTYYGYHIHLHE